MSGSWLSCRRSTTCVQNLRSCRGNGAQSTLRFCIEVLDLSRCVFKSTCTCAMYSYRHAHVQCTCDCLACVVVLLCLVVCLTLLASFFLLSSSL